MSATLWNQAACTGGSNVVTSGCYDFANNFRVSGVATGVSEVTTPGTCTPGVAGVPALPSWGQAADLCFVDEVGGGCDVDEVCAPKPDAPLVPVPCIEQEGSVDCPTSYPDRSVFHEGFSDTRSCASSGCTCGVAAGQVCETQVALYGTDDCSGQAEGAYPLDGTCHPTGFAVGQVHSGRLVGGPAGGSCPMGGSPTISGEATTLNPHTVCCAP
jgi:hypothetical protein